MSDNMLSSSRSASKQKQNSIIKDGSSKRAETAKSTPTDTTMTSNLKQQQTATLEGLEINKHQADASNVIDQDQLVADKTMEPTSRPRWQTRPASTPSSSRVVLPTNRANKPLGSRRRQQLFKGQPSGEQSSQEESSSSSSQEMTATSTSSIPTDVTLTPMRGGNIVVEQETSLSEGPNATDDDECFTLLESPYRQSRSSNKPAQTTSFSANPAGVGSRKIMPESGPSKEADIVLFNSDDDEINFEESQRLAPIKFRAQQKQRWSSDEVESEELITASDNLEEGVEVNGNEDMNDDELSNGAALTMADDDQLTTLHSEEISFVVYPLGCCDFDETQLVSTTSTRAIQKCILRLSNKPSQQEATCWGLGQSQPILMRLLEDHIQFTDIGSQTLLSSQPIQTIKSWAVDDDNNFAFVVEETPHASRTGESMSGESSVDHALLNGPAFMCYVFRSFDDDDMSCKVAAKLNAEITRYREQLVSRVSKTTRLQQMIVLQQNQRPAFIEPTPDEELAATTDLDAELDLNELDELGAANELIIMVKYIGKVQVPRPMGIDVLNVAIDTCLAEASDRSISRRASIEQDPASDQTTSSEHGTYKSALINAKLHVSPASVIVEDVETGSIIVECRIRFLTFMGISQRDIRWCGFIMQNTTNKSFVAHCFECQPTAGHVCEAIRASCSRMYEKMLRGQRTKRQQQEDATTSILPNGSKIRDTLAKTLSKIKLTPMNLI